MPEPQRQAISVLGSGVAPAPARSSAPRPCPRAPPGAAARRSARSRERAPEVSRCPRSRPCPQCASRSRPLPGNGVEECRWAGLGSSTVPEEPMVLARGLVKRFGEFTAVDGIDVEVARGEAFGFLGPNGAGKSSTMRMIGCVSPVTDGTLRVLGHDPAVDGPRDPGPARRRAAGGHPRRRALGDREPRGLRPLLRDVAPGGGRARPPAARVRPPRGARDAARSSRCPAA